MREVELKIKVRVSDDAEWLTVDEVGRITIHTGVDSLHTVDDGFHLTRSNHRVFPLIANWRDLKINLKEYFEKQNPFKLGDMVVPSYLRPDRGIPIVVEGTRDCMIKLHGQWCPSEEWKHYEKPEKPEPVIKKGDFAMYALQCSRAMGDDRRTLSMEGKAIASSVETLLLRLEKKIDASR